MLWEVINPSDAVTFRADDPKIAVGVTLLVGEGSYGLEDETGKDYPHHVPLRDEGADGEATQPYFPSLDAMFKYLKDHPTETIDALESFAVVGKDERIDYEKALDAITDPAKLKKYKADFDDRHRTSLNNICGYAHSCVKAFKKLTEGN